MQTNVKRLFIFIATLAIFIALIVLGMSLAYKSLPRLVSSKQFQSAFTQLHYIAKADEYVVVEESNSVTLGLEAKRLFMERWPIGEGQAELAVSATFKYFVRLSELRYQLDARVLEIRVPALYLSTPVAFDSASIRDRTTSTLLGPSDDKMRDELLKKVSDTLRLQGKMQMDNVRDKAAQSLAENLNQFFSNNDASGYYDQLKVVFEDDEQQLVRTFQFENSFCGDAPCDLMLELADDATLVFD